MGGNERWSLLIDMPENCWWRDGVIYQIYPRSFADADGDGLGDIRGITARLDYLAELGVDALWLSPIFPSPDADFGYDVSDHSAVDPRFGSMADFDALVRESHARGIRVILDLVLNHTSDAHPWFRESRSGRDNPKRDWYIWRDPRPGGGPPNNWKASFGGSGWAFDRPSGQYYFHMFLESQPDLNWRNPRVRRAQLDVVRFWLDRGVDGFRLDVFNAYFKDGSFRSNPRAPGLLGFDRLRHVYDFNRPEMMPLLRELRGILEGYPERYAVGETFRGTPPQAASYVGPGMLHAAFSFDFTSQRLYFPWNPRWLRGRIRRRDEAFGDGRWPTNVLSNHDLPRAASRYCRGEEDERARLAMALLLTLRGTPFLYYGEEIGMRDIRLKRREILDPPGRRYWPLYKGRDGCRGPMQWDPGPNGGFSSARPWLPAHPDSNTRNVERQRSEPRSLLNFTKALIALRREHAALRGGDFAFCGSPAGILAYFRSAGKETVLVAMNFRPRRALLRLRGRGESSSWRAIFGTSSPAAGVRGGEIGLDPYEVRVLQEV
jgi:alpha-glucosidase